MIRNLLAVLGLAVVLMAGAAGIYASGWIPSDSEPKRMLVSFAGLDLSTLAGRDILDRRVERAAREVCGDPDIRDLHAIRLRNECRDDARASAAPQVLAAIDAANLRVRLADERAQQLAYVPPAPPPVASYDQSLPTAYGSEPTPTVTRVVRYRTVRVSRPVVTWRRVKTPHGWVRKKVVRRVWRTRTVVYR